jgi:hypothetical protein
MSTGTTNTNTMTLVSLAFSGLPAPSGKPALPDCGVVLMWDDASEPRWRWETLEERDARLHTEWYRERAEQRWGYAHKNKE